MIKYSLFILLLAAACSTPKKEYADPNGQFKFIYPNTWTRHDLPKSGDVAFWSPKENEQDTFQENITVKVMDLKDQPTTLDTLAEDILQRLGTLPNKPTEFLVKPAVLANREARELTYDIMISGPLRVRMVFTIKDDVAYLLTYAAQPEKFRQYEDATIKSMQSFEFLK